ncbi:LOW QUALITY PROTEIN: hypothetical protein PHAVU_005G052800 [Phaseolus vulgaris]
MKLAGYKPDIDYVLQDVDRGYPPYSFSLAIESKRSLKTNTALVNLAKLQVLTTQYAQSPYSCVLPISISFASISSSRITHATIIGAGKHGLKERYVREEEPFMSVRERPTKESKGQRFHNLEGQYQLARCTQAHPTFDPQTPHKECEFILPHIKEKIKYLFMQISGPTHPSPCGILVNAALNVGDFRRAQQLFDNIPQPDPTTCYTLISALTTCGLPHEAIYASLWARGIKPQNSVFLAVAKASGASRDVLRFKEVNDNAIRCGMISDVFLGNALIHAYGKCKCTEGGRWVFDDLAVKDVVSWTCMYSCYINCGLPRQGLAVFHEMGRHKKQKKIFLQLNSVFKSLIHFITFLKSTLVFTPIQSTS